MLRLFDSGAVAARAQTVAVLVIGMMLLALTESGEADLAAAPREQGLADPDLLKWVFLAVSALVAVSFQQSLSRTASRLERATRLLTGGRAKRLQMALLIHLRLATAALAVLTITPPPDLLLRALAPLIDADVIAIVWAGGMSVGVAYFGAAASAARRALRPSRHSARTSTQNSDQMARFRKKMAVVRRESDLRRPQRRGKLLTRPCFSGGALGNRFPVAHQFLQVGDLCPCFCVSQNDVVKAAAPQLGRLLQRLVDRQRGCRLDRSWKPMERERTGCGGRVERATASALGG